MSVLTWRDVATPDLGPASQGIANATDAMNRAFASAAGTMDTFKDQRAQAADRNILNRTLQYKDPTELAYAIANGNVTGDDAARAHPGLLNDLHTKVTDLLNNAQIQANTAQTQASTGQTDANTDLLKTENAIKNYTQGRIVQSNTRIDALSPQMNDALSTVTDVPSMQAAQTRLTSSPEFKTLLPEEQAQFMSGFNTAVNNKLSGPKAVFDTTQGLATSQRGASVTLNVAAIKGAAGSTEQARALIDKIPDPQVREAVESQLASDFPNLVQQNQSLHELSLPLAGTGDSTPDWGEHAAFGGMSMVGTDGKPQAYSDTPIRDALAHGEQMKIETGKRIKDGTLKIPGPTSAQTPLMITNETMQNFAPKVFGRNWGDTKLTPDNVYKLGAAILSTVHTPQQLMGRWTALAKPEHAQDVQTIVDSGYDPAVANPIIIAAENGQRLENAQNAMFGNYQTGAAAALKLAQTSSREGLPEYDTYAEKANLDTKSAANELIQDKTSPVFKGAAVADIDRLIQQGKDHLAATQKDSNGRPFEANTGLVALALKSSMVPSTFFSGVNNAMHNVDTVLGGPSTYIQKNLPSGYRVDEKTYNDNLKYLTSQQGAQDAAAYKQQNLAATSIARTEKDYSDKRDAAQKAAANYQADPKKYGAAYTVAAQQLAAASRLMKDTADKYTTKGGLLQPQFPQGPQAPKISPAMQVTRILPPPVPAPVPLQRPKQPDLFQQSLQGPSQADLFQRYMPPR